MHLERIWDIPYTCMECEHQSYSTVHVFTGSPPLPPPSPPPLKFSFLPVAKNLFPDLPLGANFLRKFLGFSLLLFVLKQILDNGNKKKKSVARDGGTRAGSAKLAHFVCTICTCTHCMGWNENFHFRNRKLSKVDLSFSSFKKAKLVSNTRNKGTVFVKIFWCHEKIFATILFLQTFSRQTNLFSLKYAIGRSKCARQFLKNCLDDFRENEISPNYRKFGEITHVNYSCTSTQLLTCEEYVEEGRWDTYLALSFGSQFS